MRERALAMHKPSQVGGRAAILGYPDRQVSCIQTTTPDEKPLRGFEGCAIEPREQAQHHAVKANASHRASPDKVAKLGIMTSRRTPRTRAGGGAERIGMIVL